MENNIKVNQNEDIEELKKILLNSNPILFLGAGFSYGSENQMGTLPTGTELKKELFEKFVVGNVEQADQEEIERYDLPDLCQFIYDHFKKEEEVRAYLFERFSHARPCDFHLLLTAYEWKRIYTVNIDDLVENIYRIKQVKITVQNRQKEKNVETETELVKLHGCVNAPDEPVTFSNNEYTTLIKDKNFKLDKLMTDIMRQNVIFIGANLNERDIDFYISQYESAGFLRKGKLIFIDPTPTVKLRTRIETLDGILLRWTTEEFLNFISGLRYNPSELSRNRKFLNYTGLYLYKDILACTTSKEVYESRLYEGYASKWEDVIYNWIFVTQDIKNILEIVRTEMAGTVPSYCVAIYGNRFTGKDCVLKQIGASLYKEGYEVIEYKGKSLNISALKRYIFSSDYNKFVLLINDASYYYRLIEKLLQTNWDGKRVLILTTSRRYYHFRKKYYLEGNPYQEYEIKDRISAKDAGIIYDTIKDKGYLGDLSLERNEGITQICKMGSYINFLTELTYGSGFRKRIKEVSRSIFNLSDAIRNLYWELVIFDKADLSYYPSELLVQQYSLDFNIFGNKEYGKLDKEQRLLVDNINIVENGIVLKNRLLIEDIGRGLKQDTMVMLVKGILKNIAPYVSEEEDDYWRIIFESLLKADVLSKVFRIRDDQILQLYYSLKSDFENISYYWLQLGIAEQKVGDYAKALNHLKMAKQIRPRAYQIQHAIARNYLKNANAEKDAILAETLFKTGENMMMDLINSKENYKSKAKYFSIHCYVHEKIKYMVRYSEMVNKRTCIMLKSYIDSILSNLDDYSKNLVIEYVDMLKKYNLESILKVKPGDIYYQALMSKIVADAQEEFDPLIESM